jgi:hypothetical protein
MSSINAITYAGGTAIVVGTVYAKPFAGLYVGTAGSVTMVTVHGTITLPTTIAGTIIPIAFTSVSAAGASNLVGLVAPPFLGSP